MSYTTLCRLCVCPSSEFKTLFDDNGQLNGIYKIVVKYFDPIILNLGHKHLPNVICVQCWQLIEDFHKFQLSVLNSQAQLEFRQPVVCLRRLEDDHFNCINGAMGKQTLYTTSSTIFDVGHIEDISCDNKLNSDTLSDRLEDKLSSEILENNNESLETLVTSPDIMHTDDTHSISTQPTAVSVFELNQLHGALPNQSNDKGKRLELDDFIAKWKGELKCFECKNVYATYTLLTAHFLLKHRHIKCYTVCCAVKISSRSILVKHIKKCHMPKPLKQKKCKFCRSTFIDDDQLKNHLVMIHLKNTITYNCDVCPAIFDKVITFREHYSLKHKKCLVLTYFCPYCNIKLKTHHNLDKHMEKLHPKETANKEENRQISTELTSVKKEQTQDKTESINSNDNKVFAININNSEINAQSSSELQNKTALPKLLYCTKQPHIKEENTQYSKESTAYKVETNLEDVKESSISTYPTYTQNNIIKEEISIYPSDADSDVEQTEIQTTGNTEHNNTEELTLDLLYNIRHKSVANQLKYDAFIRKIKGDLECPKCPEEMFENFLILTQHFHSKHDNEPPFIICCNTKLISRHLICVHLRLHLNPNSFQCDLCQKCFKNSWTLKTHKRNKHEGKIYCLHPKAFKELAPEIYDTTACCKRKKKFLEHNYLIAKCKSAFECRFCKAKFAYFSMLDNHFQCKHPKEKFYIECCNQKWENITAAVRHMLKHASKKKFKCDFCNRSFQYKEYLRRHIGILHKKAE